MVFVRSWLLNGPSGPAVDEDGNLVVAEVENQRVSRFAPDGAYPAALEQVARRGTIANSGGVAIDAEGIIYVADEQNHRIDVFDRSGAPLFSWGERGTRDGQFNYVGSIDLDGQGHAYVTDVENGRVQKFKLPDGS